MDALMRVRVLPLVVGVACVFVLLPATSASTLTAEPALIVSPTRAVSGEMVTLRATGFAPGSAVDLFLDETDLTVVLADGSGGVNASLDIPAQLLPGRHWITAKARESGASVQRSLRILAPASQRAQEGNDAGRTGAAPDESILTKATSGDLQELWWRDLEVLGPGEDVFVTDAAGEISEPTAIGQDAIVATWFGDVVDEEYRETSRTRLVVLDLDTGAIRWDVVAGPAKRWGASRPVLLGDLVVVRWENDRVLLGLDLADGTERWRMTTTDRDRFGEPLVLDGRVLVTVDRPGPAADAALLVDTHGRTVATWSLPKGAGWRLYAAPDTVVAIDSSSIAALDRADGSLRWTAHTTAWWGSSSVAGDVVVTPTGDGSFEALGLRDGSRRWTWQAWPGVCDGCRSPLGGVSGASADVVYVRSFVMVCSVDEQDESCPHRVRLSALDLATGAERWFRQGTYTYADVKAMPIPGPVDVTPQVLVGADGVTDVRNGALIAAFAPPVRPGTYGAQHFWYARPIVAGGRVAMGAADGTITVFAVLMNQPRPRPAALVADPSLSPPTPTVGPTGPPRPLRAEASNPPWILAALGVAAAALISVAGLLFVRRRDGSG
jgi:outer membrane protein assembly factor BamB